MQRLLSFLVLVMFVAKPVELRADITEGFNDINSLEENGWILLNQSEPIGTTGWFQGNDAVFSSQAGTPTAYIGANFNNVDGVDIISNWLITPETTINNGDTLSFWTTTILDSTFPDRLQLLMSTNGASTNVGTMPTDVGDFTNLLVDINPTLEIGSAYYPETWTEFSVTISGLNGPENGRFAFRYFVTDAGHLGNNSNYIGLDSVQFTTAPVPEPASPLLIAGLGLATCLLRRRNR